MMILFCLSYDRVYNNIHLDALQCPQTQQITNTYYYEFSLSANEHLPLFSNQNLKIDNPQ